MYIKTSGSLPGGSASVYRKGAEAEAYAMNFPGFMHAFRKPLERR